ncbi:MAG: DUF3291 domain-containing protein [Chloroflexota bacterium]
MPSVAIFTTGPTLQPLNTSKMRPFVASTMHIFKTIAEQDGYLAHAGAEPEPGSPWGEWATPHVIRDLASDGDVVQTLTTWRDLESLMRFTYSGVHGKSIRRSSEWFVQPGYKNHVIWWVADEDHPTWAEGAARYDRIITDGITPDNFNVLQL